MLKLIICILFVLVSIHAYNFVNKPSIQNNINDALLRNKYLMQPIEAVMIL